MKRTAVVVRRVPPVTVKAQYGMEAATGNCGGLFLLGIDVFYNSNYEGNYITSCR